MKTEFIYFYETEIGYIAIIMIMYISFSMKTTYVKIFLIELLIVVLSYVINPRLPEGVCRWLHETQNKVTPGIYVIAFTFFAVILMGKKSGYPLTWW